MTTHADTEAPPPAAGTGVRASLLVFALLVVLTAAELGIATWEVDRAARISALCGLAMVKGALVLLYFMHLRRERRTLRLAVIAPLVFTAVLTVVLMLDAVVRLAAAP